MPAFIVIGLGYGDEGKGAVTNHLARTQHASGVVLSNGGAQRAHHVVLPDGRFHRFSQFGSGFFAEVPTYLDRNFLVNPHELFVEGQRLADLGYEPWSTMRGVPSISVHADALVTTPFHIAANRIREKFRGQNRHGSCGMGIGETVSFVENFGQDEALRVRDLRDSDIMEMKLDDIQHVLRKDVAEYVTDWRSVEARLLVDRANIAEAMEVYRIFNKLVPVFEHLHFDADETVIFEGGQGVLLDEFHGFHPHTTWSVTTGQNALDDLDQMVLHGYKGSITKVGVMRSYMTRHGAGPFVTEDPALAERFPEAHNGHGTWQGSWRVGWTDLWAIRYALSCINGVDELAVTHLDHVKDDWKICVKYDVGEISVPISTDRTIWEAERAKVLAQLEASKPVYIEFENIRYEDLLSIISAEMGIDIGITAHSATDYRQVVMV